MRRDNGWPPGRQRMVASSWHLPKTDLWNTTSVPDLRSCTENSLRKNIWRYLTRDMHLESSGIYKSAYSTVGALPRWHYRLDAKIRSWSFEGGWRRVVLGLYHWAWPARKNNKAWQLLYWTWITILLLSSYKLSWILCFVGVETEKLGNGWVRPLELVSPSKGNVGPGEEHIPTISAVLPEQNFACK